MKLFKRMALLLTITLISTMLISCSKTELALLDAVLKSNQALSSEKQLELSILFDYEGAPDNVATDLEMVKQVFNDMTLTTNVKTVRNAENTIVQSAIEGKVDFLMPMEFGVWVDMDVTDPENPKFIEILKQPSILAPEKPYSVIDLTSMLGGQEATVLTELMTNSGKTNEFIRFFIKEFAINFDLGETIVAKDGTIEIDGVAYPKYHLQLSDKTAKTFLRRIVNKTLEDKKTLKFIENLLAMQQKSLSNIASNLGESIDEPLEMPKPTDEEIKEAKTAFNAFMDKFNDVTLLGKDGIQIDYAMNEEGYVIYENGTIDLSINLEEIAKAFALEEDAEDAIGTYTLKIMYTINTTNINEDIKIDIPKLSHDNVAALDSLLPTTIEDLEEPVADVIDNSRDINIYVNDQKIEFENKPLLVNGRTLAPIREVIESVGGEVEWVGESQMIIIDVNDSRVELKIDNDMAFVDGELNSLDEAAKLIDGRGYIPVRYIAETIGGEVSWDNETSSIHINY